MRQAFVNICSDIQFMLKRAYNVQRSYYIVAVLNMLLSIMLSWISVLFIKWIVDAVSEGNGRNAMFCVFVYVGGIICLSAADAFVCMKKANQEMLIENQLRLQLAKKQMTLPYDQIDNKKEHEEYQFSRKAVENGSVAKILNNISSIVSGVCNIIGTFFVFSMLNGGVVLLLIAVVCVNAAGNIKKMQYQYEQDEAGVHIERSLYYARDYLTSPVFAREVRVFGLVDYVVARIRKGIDNFFHLEIQAQRKYYRNFWWTYLLNGVQLAVVYAYIGSLLYQGVLTAGEFSACISAVFLFSGAVVSGLTSFADIARSSKYIHALRRFLDKSEDRSDAKNTLVLPANGEFVISFINVSFKYDENGPYIIKNLSLELKKGDKLCIVGENGSGKTTFVKLLLGFCIPTEGEILFNGVSVSTYPAEQYQQLFSAVFQDFNLFSFRISENIAPGGGHTDEEIDRVLEKVGLTEKISSLRYGKDTYLTERMADYGTNFSGGEKQLLAIARAICKDAPVYILDEPTAALSPQNEFEIYKKFHEIARNKTVLFISHRLASCRLVDKILVMNNGCIVEAGTHEQLMRKQGIYEKMFSAQAGYYQD